MGVRAGPVGELFFVWRCEPVHTKKFSHHFLPPEKSLSAIS
jgi:hypothetical protein